MGQLISSGAVGFGSSFVYSFGDDDLYIKFVDFVEDAKDPGLDFSTNYPLLEVINVTMGDFDYGVFAVFVRSAMVFIEGEPSIHQSLDFEISDEARRQLDLFISENKNLAFSTPGNQIVLGTIDVA